MASAALMPASASMSSGLGLAGGGSVEGDSPVVRQRYDIGLLQAYLDALLPIVSSASSRELHDTLFATTSWNDVAESFASDPSVTVVYVEKVRREAAQDNEEQGEYIERRRYLRILQAFLISLDMQASLSFNSLADQAIPHATSQASLSSNASRLSTPMCPSRSNFISSLFLARRVHLLR